MAAKSEPEPLRIGYVPEHFSTPLHFAQKYYSLGATLIPFPSGTGHMITALRSSEIDIGIGLTEGWIAGLGPKRSGSGSNSSAQPAIASDGGYSLVGTYVETPLCWAISTGAQRDDVTNVQGLRGKTMGVSRVGSGSYVMGFVLADQQGWLSNKKSKGSGEEGEEEEAGAEAPFKIAPLQTFAALREGVNSGIADFFMWEHFTSKRYYASSSPPPEPASHPIRKIGEIYTPWPSWHITARTSIATTETGRERLFDFFTALDKGIAHFESHQEEAVSYICKHLDYTEEDAREWLKTVRFAGQGGGGVGVGGDEIGRRTEGVSVAVVRQTLEVLGKAGVVALDDGGAEDVKEQHFIEVLAKGMVDMERKGD